MVVSIYAQERDFAQYADLAVCPDFKMADPIATGDATLIDILCQRTGLAPHNCLWYLGPFTRAELFYRLRYLPVRPGRRPSAASTSTTTCMYMVAGQLARKRCSA